MRAKPRVFCSRLEHQQKTDTAEVLFVLDEMLAFVLYDQNAPIA